MSMGGQNTKEKGSSSGQQRDQGAWNILNVTQPRQEREIAPLKESLIAQMMSALGGNGAAIPIIANAMEQSRRAGSTANRQTEMDLARTGLSGTPFGQRTLAEGQRESAFNTGNVQGQLLSAFLQLIPQFVSAQTGQTNQLLSSAVGQNLDVTGKTKGKTTGFGVGFKE